MNCSPAPDSRPMPPILPMAPTMNSALIICATIWLCVWKIKSQRGLAFAIIDEVDSILIDEARTPLIISGAAQDSSELYKTVNALALQLQPQVEIEGDSEEEPAGDFIVDEKSRGVELTEEGHSKVEAVLVKEGLLEEDQSLYQATNLGLLHHVHSALRAQYLFHKDVEYIIQQGQASAY